MAGESDISVKGIEQRAEDLEVKLAAEAVEAEKDDVSQKEDKEDLSQKEDKTGEKKEVVKDEKTGKFTKSGEKKEPNDPVELRKWATRTSMELADVKKIVANLAEQLNKNAKKPIDYVALAKDPAKLQAAIEAREKEIVAEHRTAFESQVTQAAAEITTYESNRRSQDTENYPRWNELMPVIRSLAEPRASQPNGDPRINFNQHPKAVLDDLYQLAQDVTSNDPNYKRPDAKPAATGKSYSQEEYEAAVSKAKEDALAEQRSNLSQERKGEGVGSMGKGSSKSQPGKVDKTVLWNMPLGDLKSAIQKASE